MLCFSVLGAKKRKTAKIARQINFVPISPPSETAAVPGRESCFQNARLLREKGAATKIVLHADITSSSGCPPVSVDGLESYIRSVA